MDIELLQALVRLVDESSLDSLEIERGATRIRLAKSPSGVVVPQALPGVASLPAEAAPPALSSGSEPASPAQSAPASEPPAANLVEVTSPMVGTFYRAPSPEAEPYVEVGTSVAAGDVLCVIEAMKLMNELECEVAGRIVEICADNAEPVDYGQLLFRVDPA
ncbi:MAG: acetyl-CoA carboxylase biotin carboxyl carrier protein [Gemmatimonadetes bacterium]|nr:acetyl-CoA carboxylase biotin carboxyl carrier protein [Gemmatimonadota bacterium]MXX72203.1 acetyl-CoA carboxylase biotin carboxyl carrier protein [Gemmatimonadota bacterium]MYC91329.1 acetyl-CoA carboxylase biotin carboxyl carrier protein [Gemmatimonadota bacterium]MYG35667.1 acetyl-CoA carboxylase biotin carboxyl carrier protein [Gemmatimonadota bacterium]MYJ17323.1 acetyl-CoA carboxylase biotin carboxyl carrier protein [Gemmatimonadota bacterium]